MEITAQEARKIGKMAAHTTLASLRAFTKEQLAEEALAQQAYQQADYDALALGLGDVARTFSSIAADEARHQELLKDIEKRLGGGNPTADFVETELAFHIAEHEVLGGARMVDKSKAEDPAVACRCFGSGEEEYCWKPGYLGLISSKKNPQQMAHCVIKVPAGAGTAKRFAELRGAISQAHREWEKTGGGLKEWWEAVGRQLEEKGVSV